MTIVTLKSPEPNQNFWAGAQDISSDQAGLITGVDLHSQVCRDLFAAGCQVFHPADDSAPEADASVADEPPAAAEAVDLPDPVV